MSHSTSVEKPSEWTSFVVPYSVARAAASARFRWWGEGHFLRVCCLVRRSCFPTVSVLSNLDW